MLLAGCCDGCGYCNSMAVMSYSRQAGRRPAWLYDDWVKDAIRTGQAHEGQAHETVRRYAVVCLSHGISCHGSCFFVHVRARAYVLQPTCWLLRCLYGPSPAVAFAAVRRDSAATQSVGHDSVSYKQEP